MGERTYQDLTAWQVGMSLVEECYRSTGMFPSAERFGLTAQIRRAAISIPANIAEGATRRHKRAFANHVSIALGSHAELETYIELGRRLGYFNDGSHAALSGSCARTGQLLNGLHNALWRSINSPHA
jgi:four helix bundle protein